MTREERLEEIAYQLAEIDEDIDILEARAGYTEVDLEIAHLEDVREALRLERGRLLESE